MLLLLPLFLSLCLPATTAIPTTSHSLAETFLIVRFIMAIYIIFKILHYEMWNVKWIGGNEDVK